MTTIPFRCLVLDDRTRLGQSDGPNRFRLHWEFWSQLAMMFHGRLGRHLTEIVTAGQAKSVADIIEETGNERWWNVHLGAWGDGKRRTVRSLVKFLRAGGFAVVLPTSGQKSEGRIMKIEKHL